MHLCVLFVEDGSPRDLTKEAARWRLTALDSEMVEGASDNVDTGTYILDIVSFDATEILRYPGDGHHL